MARLVEVALAVVLAKLVEEAVAIGTVVLPNGAGVDAVIVFWGLTVVLV